MRNTTFRTQVCSVARALEVIGEWWTLLIVREAFFGTERFSDFEDRLGIAKNVLSERLSKLVQSGVMTRTAANGRGNPQIYRLTEMGRDLLPIVVALMQWGDKWINRETGAPIRVIERKTGRPVCPVELRGEGGTSLRLEDLRVATGPGANVSIRQRFRDE
jgi:DNA-binding HxlR family transcriptional regulator